jgi:large subunit ribosomal protein L31
MTLFACKYGRVTRLEQVSCLSQNKLKGLKMRKDIHPDYMECKVSCACGNKFEVRSNKPEMSIDICNECHPFFTGSEKILDAAGRVEKFKNKYKLN